MCAWSTIGLRSRLLIPVTSSLADQSTDTHSDAQCNPSSDPDLLFLVSSATGTGSTCAAAAGIYAHTMFPVEMRRAVIEWLTSEAGHGYQADPLNWSNTPN
jgi:hypothetical protein